MKKSAEIMGLPIISITEGIEVGTVQTLVIDGAQRTTVALAVDDGKWYKAAKLLPLSAILGVGESAITIESSNNVVSLENAPELEKLLEADISVVGSRVLTKGGEWKGVITEMTIDENGRIVSFDVETDATGVVETVDAERVYTFAKDVTVIGAEEDKVPVQPVAAAVSAPAAPKTAEVVETAAKVVAAPEAAPEAASDAAQKVEEKSKRFMIGKKATRKIQTESGLLIVDQGSEITEEVIQKAKLANKFVELTMSVQ